MQLFPLSLYVSTNRESSPPEQLVKPETSATVGDEGTVKFEGKPKVKVLFTPKLVVGVKVNVQVDVANATWLEPETDSVATPVEAPATGTAKFITVPRTAAIASETMKKRFTAAHRAPRAPRRGRDFAVTEF